MGTNNKASFIVNVKKCKNFSELIQAMGMKSGGHSYKKVREFVVENNIDISHFPKSTKTSDLNIKNCHTMADVVRELNLPDGGWGYRKAKDYVKRHNLDTSHFVR